MDNSKNGKSEKEQFWKVKILKNTIRERKLEKWTIPKRKKGNSEKRTFEKEQF